jgi:putative intracellular protease/amidase
MPRAGTFYILHTLRRRFSTDIFQPESVHPLHVLAPHCEITVASHLGGEAPLDTSSIESFKEDEVCSRFVKEQESLWKNTLKLEEFVRKADQFDAIFYVGGYGREFSH